LGKKWQKEIFVINKKIDENKLNFLLFSMTENNLKFFINDIKYIVNFQLKSMVNYYNNENKNKKIISGISNYYIKFIFKLNDQLDEEKIINNNLREQLKNERIINNNLREQLENLQNKEITIKCPICYDKDLSICCIPCGHTYCYKCIINTKNCHICRTEIKRTNKIYL